MPPPRGAGRWLWAALVCLAAGVPAPRKTPPSRNPRPPMWRRPPPRPSGKACSTSRSASPGRPASCRANGRRATTSSPSRTAGASASRQWDRYGKGHPPVDDYPYVEGHWWDPFNQNVLKGDYPIVGQNTFLNLTAESRTDVEARQVPTQTTPFESTARPGEFDFFGRPNQFVRQPELLLSRSTCSTATPRSSPWTGAIKLTPVFNVNDLNVKELGAGQSRRARRHEPRPHLLRPPGVVRASASSPTSAPTTTSCRCASARSRSPAISAASSSATSTAPSGCSARWSPTATSSTWSTSTSWKRTPTASSTP